MPPSRGKSIAVVGAGVSGISAAYHVRKYAPADTEVVLIESNAKIGGHAWTFGKEDRRKNRPSTATGEAGLPDVDAGFMVSAVYTLAVAFCHPLPCRVQLRPFPPRLAPLTPHD